MKIDGAKKSAKPPRLRGLLPTDEGLGMNIKPSHYVAVMWENCVIGNLPQVNPCEYGWERNEGERSLRPNMLQTGIKLHLTRFCKQHAANVFHTSAKN